MVSFQIRDKREKAVGIIRSKAEDSVATGTEPASEMALFMAMIEGDLASVATTERQRNPPGRK